MKNIKLRVKLMTLSILPMLVIGAVIAAVTLEWLSSTIVDETENSLRSTAEAVLAAYDQNTGDYFQNENGDIWKGGYNVSKSEALLDKISNNTGMAVTFFYGSKRIVTSLKDKNGDRILGSEAGKTVQKKVLQNKKSFFTNGVSVDGKMYYGYYIPVNQNESKDVVGMVFVGTPTAKVSQKINRMIVSFGIILLLALVVTTVIVIYVAGRMIKRIKSGIQTLTDIAGGDLTTNVEKKYLNDSDEIGELIQSTQQLKAGLTDIISVLAQKTKQLGQSSNDINEMLEINMHEIDRMENAIEQISDGMNKQAKSADDASDGISTINNMIEKANTETKTLNISAKEMLQAGSEVSSTLDNLDAVNAEVLKAVEQIQQDTDLTNEAAEQIGKAVDVIMNIAEETNLLSLNASIEAARAGESGKGFAVVASQIQKLAEQSGESSEQINTIVNNLGSSSAKSVETMAYVREVIDKQSNDIVKTREIFGEVERGIDHSMDGILRIEQAIGNLEEAKGSIVELIAFLTQATKESKENAAVTLESAHSVKKSVTDMVQASNGVKEVAHDINDSVSTFRIE